MKNNKIIIIITIFIVSWILLYIFLNKNDKSIVWTYISDKEYTQDLFNEKNENISGSWNANNEDKDKVWYDKISSMIRTVCLNIKDTKTLVNTTSFKLIKAEVTKIKNNLSENKEKFTYVILPWIVFNNCKNDDDTFIDKLVTILQNDWNEILTSSKDELNWLFKFIDEIEFNRENIDKTKLKTSKEYFYEVFFQKNITPIMHSYFFETSYNLWDFKKYIFNVTFLSFWEVNNLLEKTVMNFQDFVKDLGFKDLTEFNNYLLKNNWYKSLDELKDDAVKKYVEFAKKVKSELWFNLDEKLLSLDSTYEFYLSDDYKKLKENKELFNLYKEIAELHLYFAVIWWDYANNLSEWWSWKMFFWDSLIWNWIIRLFYIYYFDLLNS